MAKRVLSNNQINEIGLWQELVQRLRELENLGGMERLFAEFWGENGVILTVPALNDGVKVAYTIFLDPHQAPLRVTWGHGSQPSNPCGYESTRRFLRHVIIEVEEALAWEEHYLVQRAEAEEEWQTEFCPCGHKRDKHYLEQGYCDAPGCGCPDFGEPVESWETYTIVNVGDGPGGFRIVE